MKKELIPIREDVNSTVSGKKMNRISPLTNSYFMDQNNEFDFGAFKKQAIEGMYAGKSLNGEKGIFALLLKHFLETALKGELQSHLQEEKASGLVNRKNGKTTKRVKSLSGEFDIQPNRDCSGSFEPVILPKRQLIITEERT